jgi:hypothetical protein
MVQAHMVGTVMLWAIVATAELVVMAVVVEVARV